MPARPAGGGITGAGTFACSGAASARSTNGVDAELAAGAVAVAATGTDERPARRAGRLTNTMSAIAPTAIGTSQPNAEGCHHFLDAAGGLVLAIAASIACHRAPAAACDSPTARSPQGSLPSA